MEIFHGTDQTSAATIIGPPAAVNVTLGGGELGRGFYAGSEISMAAARAKGRQRALLEITIDNAAFVKLDRHIIAKRRDLISQWNDLKTAGTTRSHLFKRDVVVAPFATFSFAWQYKFESKKLRLY